MVPAGLNHLPALQIGNGMLHRFIFKRGIAVAAHIVSLGACLGAGGLYLFHQAHMVPAGLNHLPALQISNGMLHRFIFKHGITITARIVSLAAVLGAGGLYLFHQAHIVPGGGDHFPLVQVLNGSGGFLVLKRGIAVVAHIVGLGACLGAGGLYLFHQGHAMLLKHRGNGDGACGHFKGVFFADRHITLCNLPLHKVVALAGNRSQGNHVPSSSGGVVGSSRAACGGIDRHRVCGLGQGDLQLIQLGRLGVRTGEHQGAGSGLGDHQVKGGGMGLRCIVRGTSCHRTFLDVFTTPGQSVAARATAVERLHRVGARHRSIVIEGNGVLLVQAVDVLPMAGPNILGHLKRPTLVAFQNHIVKLGKLRLQGGSLALVGEHKGIRSGVLRPPHQVSHGSLNGLLGIGKGYGGRSFLCQYHLGSLNGLSIGIPAALVPLRPLFTGLVHQILDLLFGHFRSGNHRTGAADLL